MVLNLMMSCEHECGARGTTVTYCCCNLPVDSLYIYTICNCISLHFHTSQNFRVYYLCHFPLFCGTTSLCQPSHQSILRFKWLAEPMQSKCTAFWFTWLYLCRNASSCKAGKYTGSRSKNKVICSTLVACTIGNYSGVKFQPYERTCQVDI